MTEKRTFLGPAAAVGLIALVLAASCGGKDGEKTAPGEKPAAIEAPVPPGRLAPEQPSDAAPGTGPAAPAAPGGEQSGLAQMQALAAMGKALEQAAKQAESAPATVTPVHFRDLLAFLPEEAAQGLEPQKPFGESQSMGGFSTSQASRAYTSKEGQRLEVKIMDTGFAPMLVNPFFMMAKTMQRETTEEYQKGTEVAGQPAIEKFHYANKDGEIQILVGKRFMVEVSGSGFADPKPIQALAARMDLKGLGALAERKAEAPK